VDRAKACGFSLPEIRQLLYGFRDGAPPSERWQVLARRKTIDLDEMARKIAAMKEVLERSCTCKEFKECGQRILAKKRSMPRHQSCGAVPVLAPPECPAMFVDTRLVGRRRCMGSWACVSVRC
jgi:hypothetical protein